MKEAHSLQIGISTASFFNRMTIEDAVLQLGAHGVPAAELFLNSFCEYEPAFTAMLAERARAANLRIHSVHPMSTQFEPQLFSLHPRQREDAFRIYERVLQAARTLGAACYVMHGAATLNGAAKNLELARIAPIFSELDEMARAYGVTLALENVSWCLFCTPSFGLRLRELTKDRMHFTLDIKQAVRSGFSPEDYMDAVGDRIVNVHLCDYERLENGAFRWRMPTQGQCDFSALRAALLAHGYRGPAFVEVYSDMYDDVDALYRARTDCECALGA